ncbi:unnamed protein product [Cochlearia groenlandica]
MAVEEEDNKESQRDNESSPLLGNTKKTASIVSPHAAEGYGWKADGFPVIGESIVRNQWSSGLFGCLGRNDEFCSSDLEVCILGSVAPCVLYGTNAERLGSGSGTFANHCLTYSGLYFLGNASFGWNWLAPCFSCSTRSTIRRKFNLEGTFEAMNRSCGCCGSCIEDEMQREQMETTCDFVTHVLCHTCALCQEGREIRRKILHPGFKAKSTVVVLPPKEQTMGRK